MKATEKLHNAGQSLWLDNITRDLLTSGTLKRYIDTLSVTGLTSNPTIFDHAISKSAAYDQDIRAMTRSGVPREDLVLQACDCRSAAGSGPVQADPRPDRGRRWVGLARSVASLGL